MDRRFPHFSGVNAHSIDLQAPVWTALNRCKNHRGGPRMRLNASCATLLIETHRFRPANHMVGGVGAGHVMRLEFTVY